MITARWHLNAHVQMRIYMQSKVRFVLCCDKLQSQISCIVKSKIPFVLNINPKSG